MKPKDAKLINIIGAILWIFIFPIVTPYDLIKKYPYILLGYIYPLIIIGFLFCKIIEIFFFNSFKFLNLVIINLIHLGYKSL